MWEMGQNDGVDDPELVAALRAGDEAAILDAFREMRAPDRQPSSSTRRSPIHKL